ncbi:MAG: hypothetical protein FWH01_06615 [Oscillospiraceae bacterium]|nr:hypothetical protein [Oscillospiraceae bacterium]
MRRDEDIAPYGAVAWAAGAAPYGAVAWARIRRPVGTHIVRPRSSGTPAHHASGIIRINLYCNSYANV